MLFYGIILLAEKQWHVLRHFFELKLSHLIYLIPVGLEFAIAIIMRAIITPASIPVTPTNSLRTIPLKDILHNIFYQTLLALNEEFISRFVFFVIFLLVLRLLKVQNLEKKHPQLFICLSALTFALMHITTYIGQTNFICTNKQCESWFLSSALVSAFAIGFYLNAVFLKTRSLAIITIIHTLINFCRSWFTVLSLGNINAFLISLNFFSLIYFLSGLIIIRQGFNLKKLEKISANI